MRTLFGSCPRLTATLLFAVSTTLVAQSARSSSTLMMQQPLSQGCPVTLRANHLPGNTITRAEDSKRARNEPLRISFRPTLRRPRTTTSTPWCTRTNLPRSSTWR